MSRPCGSLQTARHHVSTYPCCPCATVPPRHCHVTHLPCASHARAAAMPASPRGHTSQATVTLPPPQHHHAVATPWSHHHHAMAMPQSPHHHHAMAISWLCYHHVTDTRVTPWSCHHHTMAMPVTPQLLHYHAMATLLSHHHPAMPLPWSPTLHLPAPYPRDTQPCLTVHLWGFSPVCRRMCTTSMYWALKGRRSREQASQWHTNSFFSPWMCSLLMCFRGRWGGGCQGAVARGQGAVGWETRGSPSTGWAGSGHR